MSEITNFESIMLKIDTSNCESHLSFEKAMSQREESPHIPIFLDNGDGLGYPYSIKLDAKTREYTAWLDNITVEEFIQKTGHKPEEFILVPSFHEMHFKIGTKYDLNFFRLKLINVDETVGEIPHTHCYCKPMKIYKRDLVTKTGSEKVILAHFENGLITEMNRMAQQIGGYNSPDTWYNPTFSICKVEDVKDPSKYIVRGLTGYRYTNHDTIEFNNDNARSYMRTTVDMNVDDLGGKCAVFDSRDGEFDEHSVVCFDQFITCKDVYKFIFETGPDDLFNNGGRMIFGKLKYTGHYGVSEELGMLGITRRPAQLVFIHADCDHLTITFSLKEILRDAEWRFEIRDCRFCELVPMELAYLKEQ